MFSDTLLTAMRNARHIAVLTGAGISAESGVPTFRSTEGLWKEFKPEELATFDAFVKNPALVTEWYNTRRRIICDVDPNDGHRALVQFERNVDTFSLITQNIDGLHQRAGSRRVIELHGNIHRNFCVRCRSIYTKNAWPPDVMPPRCVCGGLIRPDVVWFGEFLPEAALIAAQHMASACDVFLSVGTSAVVYPAAALPMLAQRYGAFVVEINIEETDLSPRVDESIIGKAGTVLPALVAALF